ncbi:hypothetical protein C8J57DRAFT_1526135 [Mycena rebaudengoi]|nr:hypothetical protein C8J57DRAFT_1526135 [Mycena rebaudengoi]
MALEEYLEFFLCSIKNAPKITETSILSVAYCRTLGAASYPFLIVYLQHPELDEFPIRLKLQGFDGPATIQVVGREPRYDTLGEGSTLSVAFVGETLMELVGTWRYDEVPAASQRCFLSAQWNHTRERCPTTLFLVLRHLFDGVVTSRRKAPALPMDVNSDMKCAVVDAFRPRRQRMQEEIDIMSGYRHYIEASQTLQLRGENAELLACTEILQDEVFRLKLEGIVTRISTE